MNDNGEVPQLSELPHPCPWDGWIGLPPHLFHCLLDDQPTHLVPTRYLRREKRPEDRDCFISGSAGFSWLSLPPADIDRWFARCAPANGTVWVSDPATGSLALFQLGPVMRGILSKTRPGDRVPSGIEDWARALLFAAGIFTTSDAEDERRKAWSAIVEHGRESVKRDGYAALACLIHPFNLGALRRYFRYLTRTGELQLGDGQSPKRYVAHNESVARLFHHQLAGVVGAIAGEPVKPSYVYVASYQEGAELPAHTDREQCEFSLTMLLDYSPEPARQSPWPLRLETTRGTLDVYQAIGDTLLYRGRTLRHSRPPLARGAMSTSIFFHFVREGFSGSLE
jgi:hypothetical protein